MKTSCCQKLGSRGCYIVHPRNRDLHQIIDLMVEVMNTPRSRSVSKHMIDSGGGLNEDISVVTSGALWWLW